MNTWQMFREKVPSRSLGVSTLGLWLLLAILPAAGLRAQEEETAIFIEPVFPGGGLLADNPFRPVRQLTRVKIAEAEVAYGETFSQKSLAVEACFDRVLELENRKQYADALREVDQFLRKEPSRSYLYSMRAFLRCMVMESRDREALRAAERDLEQTL